MDSFVYLVVCKTCKYAVAVEEVYAHLAGKNHQNVLQNERKRIADQIALIPGIIKTADQLKQFQFLGPTSKAIPELEEPRIDGLGCEKCTYISCHRKKI